MLVSVLPHMFTDVDGLLVFFAIHIKQPGGPVL